MKSHLGEMLNKAIIIIIIMIVVVVVVVVVIQPESDGCRDGNFYTTGVWYKQGMGLDCQNFLRTLANKLSSKSNEPYGSVISWLRIQLSFGILRTVHRCVRGSRYPFKSREVSEDFTLAVAGLHLYL